MSRKRSVVLLLPGAGGSLGDILPVVRLGVALADHGHSVVAVLGEKTRSALESAARLDERFEIALAPEASNGRLEWVRWLPVPGRRLLAFLLVNAIPESLARRDFLQDLLERRRDLDVVVGSCVGIEQLRRSLGFAQVLVGPSPYVAAAWQAPAYRAVWEVGNGIAQRLVIRPSLRKRGVEWTPLPARWQLLGLWSPLLLASGSAGRISWESIGFPPPTAGTEPALPEALEAFLRSGPPPIVFSFGSYSKTVGVDRVVRLATEVTGRLGARAVVTTMDKEEAATVGAVPDSMFVSSFVDLDALLPRARVLVHHGGIGTTACALRAGVPSVAAPMAFDQPWNARRCAAIGAGVVVEPATRMKGTSLVQAIERVSDDGHRESLREISRRVREENGFAAAVARIEALP